MLDEILKTRHQALFVEIELTSYCNARCVHCPRHNMRPSGMMSEQTFRAILDRYHHYRDELVTHAGDAARVFPKLIFAGVGRAGPASPGRVVSPRGEAGGIPHQSVL